MKSLWSPSPESSTVHLLKTSLSWKQVGRRPREGPGEIYPAYLQNQTVMYCCFRQQRQNKSCFISICPGQPNEFPNWVSKPVVRCDWNDFQGQRDPQGLVRMIFMVRSSIFPVLRLKNVLCMDLSGALKEHLYSLSREKHDLNPNMACCCLLCSSVQLKIIVSLSGKQASWDCLMTFTGAVGGHSCPPTLYNPPMRPHHVQLSGLIIHQ